jgi:hypothetical protein
MEMHAIQSKQAFVGEIAAEDLRWKIASFLSAEWAPRTIQ